MMTTDFCKRIKHIFPAGLSGRAARTLFALIALLALCVGFAAPAVRAEGEPEPKEPEWKRIATADMVSPDLSNVEKCDINDVQKWLSGRTEWDGCEIDKCWFLYTFDDVNCFFVWAKDGSPQYISMVKSALNNVELMKEKTGIQVYCVFTGAEHHAAVAATCTVPGSMEYWETGDGRLFGDEICSHETSLDELTVPALGHEWDSGTTKIKPSYFKSGEKIYVCRREGCGETRTETLPRLLDDREHIKSAARSIFVALAAMLVLAAGALALVYARSRQGRAAVQTAGAAPHGGMSVAEDERDDIDLHDDTDDTDDLDDFDDLDDLGDIEDDDGFDDLDDLDDIDDIDDLDDFEVVEEFEEFDTPDDTSEPDGVDTESAQASEDAQSSGNTGSSADNDAPEEAQAAQAGDSVQTSETETAEAPDGTDGGQASPAEGASAAAEAAAPGEAAKPAEDSGASQAEPQENAGDSAGKPVEGTTRRDKVRKLAVPGMPSKRTRARQARAERREEVPRPVQQTKPEQRTEAPRPVHQAKPEQRAEPPRPVKQTQPEQHTEPRPTQQTKPEQRTEPPRPVHQAKPEQRAEPPRPVQQTQPEQHTEAPRPTQQTQPEQRTEPPRPVQQTKPEQRAEPPRPVQSTKPSQPERRPAPAPAAYSETAQPRDSKPREAVRLPDMPATGGAKPGAAQPLEAAHEPEPIEPIAPLDPLGGIDPIGDIGGVGPLDSLGGIDPLATLDDIDLLGDLGGDMDSFDVFGDDNGPEFLDDLYEEDWYTDIKKMDDDEFFKYFNE